MSSSWAIPDRRGRALSAWVRWWSPSTAGVQAAHLVDLMYRVARGDQHAFAELYGYATVRRVFGAVLQVLRSPEHAEESNAGRSAH